VAVSSTAAAAIDTHQVLPTAATTASAEVAVSSTVAAAINTHQISPTAATTASAEVAVSSTAAAGTNIRLYCDPVSSRTTLPYHHELVRDKEFEAEIHNWAIRYAPRRYLIKDGIPWEYTAGCNIDSIRDTLLKHPEFAEVFHKEYLSKCVPRETVVQYLKKTEPNNENKDKKKKKKKKNTEKEKKRDREQDEGTVETSNKRKKEEPQQVGVTPQQESTSPAQEE